MNTTDSLHRWELVSSLYGPGTFWSWLCIVASVLISWAMNPNTAPSDSVTNDLIGALTLPVVAAADSFYQLAKYDRPDRPSIFLSDRPEDIQLVAAVEAPLAICEVYVILALFLHSTIDGRYQWKRMCCVLLTTLLCFSTQLVVFFTYPGLHISTSRFARPFLFHFAVMLDFASGILAILIGISMILTTIGTMYRKTRPLRDRNQALPDRRRTKLESRSNLFASIIIALGIATIKTGFVYNTSFYNAGNVAFHTRFSRFTPKSSIPFTDLDQIVALAGGLSTLVVSICDCIKARRSLIHRDG